MESLIEIKQRHFRKLITKLLKGVNWLKLRTLTISSIDRDIEELKFFHIAGGNFK
jgi:hypothetical protein